MVRFKVIKASHLLLFSAAVILFLVVAGIILNIVFSPAAEVKTTQSNFVYSIDAEKYEAETKTVFASIDSAKNALHLDPESDDGLSIEIIHGDRIAQAEQPSILIYHTHTHEAYEQEPDDQYVAIEAWRTMDHDYSIVRVGEELAELLRDCGFEVVHNTKDHEQNALNTAYSRSLETLQSYDQQFDLYIDLHRDAFIEGTDSNPLMIDGKSTARMMMLIGNGKGFQEKPYYQENFAFAEELTQRINDIAPGLCKEVLVKDGRYNQHIGIFSILIEIGHNRNTLDEALASLPFLAQGIKNLMIEEPDSALKQMKQNHISSSG